MANICSFEMVVRGNESNIQTFLDMMQQKGTTYMGRGAEVYDYDMQEDDNEISRCQISGGTKWSIQSSLIDNAISMREDLSAWYFGDIDKTKLTFVTLFEACKQLNLDMECYSEECGCEFQEHYLFKDGELLKDECVDYQEVYDEDSEDYFSIGGFDSWDFSI